MRISLELSGTGSRPGRVRHLASWEQETNRKHPKLEYKATLISFVVAMLTFSGQSLRAPSQE
jgi:hypothetical protein